MIVRNGQIYCEFNRKHGPSCPHYAAMPTTAYEWQNLEREGWRGFGDKEPTAQKWCCKEHAFVGGSVQCIQEYPDEGIVELSVPSEQTYEIFGFMQNFLGLLDLLDIRWISPESSGHIAEKWKLQKTGLRWAYVRRFLEKAGCTIGPNWPGVDD